MLEKIFNNIYGDQLFQKRKPYQPINTVDFRQSLMKCIQYKINLDTKWETRSRNSKKDSQYHDPRKKYKRTDNGRQNIKQKTKYWAPRISLKIGWIRVYRKN
jgi:hypothetical protein